MSDPIDRFLLEMRRTVYRDFSIFDLFFYVYDDHEEANQRCLDWLAGRVLPFKVYKYVKEETGRLHPQIQGVAR